MSWLGDAIGDVWSGAKGAVGTIAGGVPGMVASGAGALAGKGGGALGGLGGMMGGMGGGSNPLMGMVTGYLGRGNQGGGQGSYSAPAGYAPQSFGGGPWPSFPGQPNGNPQPQQFHGDFSDQGPAEKFFQQNQDKWTAPTQGSNWWNENKGKFGAGIADQYWEGLAGKGNPPTTSNNAQGAYNEFQSSSPQDMSSYYDNAVRKTGEGIERAYAARGMRGNSSELDQLSEATGNLRAQEAKDNAGYGLQRAGLAGTLASGADVSSGRDINNQLSWMTGLGGLGLGVQNSDLQRLLGAAGIATGLDQTGLSWLNSGMNAAQGAQGAMERRGQDFFENNLTATQAQTGSMLPIYLAMLQNDAALQNAAIDASTGYAREGANQASQGRAQTEQGLSNLIGLLGSGAKSGLF